MNRQEAKIKLNELKTTDFWKDLLVSAKRVAATRSCWMSDENPDSPTNSTFVRWELNNLFERYQMDMDYDELEDQDYKYELGKIKELEKRIKQNPNKLEAWKNDKRK